MSKIDSIVCTTVYDEFLTVIDVFKCKNCGHKYVEVFWTAILMDIVSMKKAT